MFNRKISNLFKGVALMLALVLVLFTFSACGEKETETLTKDNIKIGLITLHDDSATYDKNFIDSMKQALANLGINESQLVLTTGIAENESCYAEAKRMAQDGCDIVFADSFGHESYIIQAAQEFPKVQFAHATGTLAHTYNLENYANAFASIYEGRYVAGVIAGMKLKEMIDNQTITTEQAIVGYVGAYPYAEVKSGYTAWYLGVRSVVAEAKMVVRFTGTWYDTDLEYAAAKALIETDKCVLISQHADSYGAPNACEELGVPDITYNGTTSNIAPNTYLGACRINWTPYFEYLITTVLEGKFVDIDYTGTFETGSVVVLELGANCATGTQEAVDTAIASLKDGTLKVFDTSKFTVEGKTLTTYLADVNTDDNYTPDTEVIIDGIFEESKFRSAPYFDIDIDGITIINN